MDCPFYDLCSKSMCDNYKYLTTRPSGTPRCDAFREKGNFMDKAEKIVKEILADLKGRRGFRQEWENIDDDIQDELKSKWIRIVRDNM